jgi:hypothetical protein
MKRLIMIRNLSYFISLTLAVGLIGFIILQNLAPFGITVKYDLQNKSKYLSTPGPKERVAKEDINGKTSYKQISDLIYFSTVMPFHFDKATVRIQLKNDILDQAIKVGYKDQEDWHYNNKVIDAPLLSLPSWSSVGDTTVLYQRKKTYSSVQDFFKRPPKDVLVGTYDYATDKLTKTTIPGYKPQTKETVINTPFRGKVTMFAYLQDEPFHMSVTKQDLNWYKDTDPATITVFKDDVKVFDTSIDDDGITDASRKITTPQTVSIKNPGPGLPETGVYKIVISASSDIIIKQIKTNLHKIVFDGTMLLAGNAEVYSKIISQTYPTTVYTNALVVSVLTYHDQALQRITTPKKTLRLTKVNQEGQIIPEDDLTQMTIPKNDVILKGYAGYFALDKNQFFLPTAFRTVTISQASDIDLVDYILTDKKPAKQIGDWRVVEQTYDLNDATIDNGKLSWLIQAPKLQDNHNTITIGDIEVTLHKKPLFSL